MKNNYLSIGEYCATAYQIRRRSGSNDAFFFDWLISRGDSFACLANDRRDVLLLGDWEIVEGGIRLLDRGTGLIFQHEFPVIQGSREIDAQQVEMHMPIARRKFQYLAAKTAKYMQETDRTVLVRAENDLRSADSALSRVEDLKAAYWPLSKNLRFILASTSLDCDVVTRDAVVARLDAPVGVSPEYLWRGNDRSWDRVFDLAEALLEFD